MTIQVYSNHGTFNVISVTHGDKEWFFIEKYPDEPGAMAKVTEGWAKKAISEHKLHPMI